MSRKRPLSPSTNEQTVPSNPVQTFKSTPIEDRSSTFVAAFSPTLSAKQLQALPEFKSAMHRMAGWRKPSAQQTLVGTSVSSLSNSSSTSGPISKMKTTFISGCDDDGEKYGGRRLEKVLNDLDIQQGSVVVARWYGGILLGPVRFTHIENVAKEAISKWRESLDSGGVDRLKKRKVEQDNNDDDAHDSAAKAKLIKQLQDRDQSIVVLRQLLAEKNTSQAAKSTITQTEPDEQIPIASPVKQVDYANMTSQRLKQLDKARDATIAWLLKQIDTVETSVSSLS